MQRFIVQANISHFRKLIAEETDPKKLESLQKFLAEEEAKLATLDARQWKDIAGKFIAR